MTPPNPLVVAANAALANADVRATVRQMHADGASLIDMVEALGLAPSMSAEIRRILQRLPADAVAGIRQATLEMLDRGEQAMPLDCEVTEGEIAAGVPTAIDVAPQHDVSTIRIRRAPAP